MAKTVLENCLKFASNSLNPCHAHTTVDMLSSANSRNTILTLLTSALPSTCSKELILKIWLYCAIVGGHLSCNNCTFLSSRAGVIASHRSNLLLYLSCDLDLFIKIHIQANKYLPSSTFEHKAKVHMGRKKRHFNMNLH